MCLWAQGNPEEQALRAEADNHLTNFLFMKSSRDIRAVKLILLLLFAFMADTMSQPDSSSATADTINKSIKDRHALYAAGGYGSNMIYLGSTISRNQPYGFAALSYGFNNSFYLTFSTVHLANYSPVAAFITGNLSYSHTFNSWFDIFMSASRYQVAPSLREVLFNNFYYGDFTIGADWRLLYTKLSAGVLYMDESSFYYQIKNSRFFSTPSFFRKKATVTFDPYVNILLGTLSTLELKTDTITTVTYPFYKGSTGTGSGSGNGYGGGSGTGTSSATTPVTTTQPVTSSVISQKFGIMEINFGLPVSFNMGSFTLEAEPAYVIPMYDEETYPGTKGFLMMVSCYLKLF